MSRLTWNETSTKKYETGVDRGVLFLDEIDGVPWNGLVSVAEKSVGGDVESAYLDGVKFLHYTASEEFAATIEAFYSPEEFDLCDGSAEFSPGSMIHQQPRQSFGLSYRTKIGNDVDGIDHGHKLHLVYNALASPSSFKYGTMSDSPDVGTMTWEITTKPVIFPGFTPSAHLTFDSTKDQGLYEMMENILYGTSTTSSRLPTFQEIQDLAIAT